MRPFLASSSKARKRLASMTPHSSIPLRDSAAPLTRLALSTTTRTAIPLRDLPGLRPATSLPACGGAMQNKNKPAIERARCWFISFCGEGGIRTPGAFQLNSFQDCRNRPLYHLSKRFFPIRDCKYRYFPETCKIYFFLSSVAKNLYWKRIR